MIFIKIIYELQYLNFTKIVDQHLLQNDGEEALEKFGTFPLFLIRNGKIFENITEF